MRCEAMAGELGLFAEEIDVLRQIFLGNTPRPMAATSSPALQPAWGRATAQAFARSEGARIGSSHVGGKAWRAPNAM